MIVLLLPVVAAILVCYYTHWPVNLLYKTECTTIDSLRTYIFVLEGEPKPTARCERFEARMKDGNVLLYIARDSMRTMPQTGDTLIARTRIRRGGVIGTFDYGTYLRRQGIIGTAYIGTHSIVRHIPSAVKPQPPLQKRLYRRLAESGLQGDELATVGALTLGYKEDLDPELRRRFQASGAAHVLAVSGLHTGIIYGIILWLLTLGGRLKPRYENRAGRWAISVTVIAVMWFYAWLTGLTPSVVRAVVMVSLVEIGKMAYRNSLSLNTIAAAAVLILLVRPLDLWSVSFQLSFAATAAIVVFYPKIRYDGNPVFRYFLSLILVSLAAQVGTLPITLHTFGQVSTYFLLTNCIVLPIATFLVPFGMFTILLGGSIAGVLLGKITWALAWIMNHAVGWIESLPGSTVTGHCNGWMICIYYLIIVLFYLLVLKKHE